MQYLVFKPTDILDFNFISFFASWFMHGSVSHLIGNVIAIMVMGRVVERKMGFAKTALIYFGAGAIANLFSALIYLFIIGTNTGGIGASGCVMGLIAAAILLDPFYISFETIIPMPIITTGLLYIWSDITGVLTMADDNIGHFAHIGGFISIPILMYLFTKKDRNRFIRGMVIDALLISGAIIIYVLVKQY